MLKYHVASGLLPASEVVKLDGKSAETIGGELVWIELKDGKVYVNDAEVVITDVKTSNGIIHVLDAVLVPQDIVETASANGDFDTLVTAVTAAGLADDLSAPNGPYTVFAPTTTRLQRCPTVCSTVSWPTSRTHLGVLTYHVLGDALRLDRCGQLGRWHDAGHAQRCNDRGRRARGPRVVLNESTANARRSSSST